jgi:hypothetical protein
MKTRDTHPDAAPLVGGKLEKRLSRRTILQTAMAGSVAASVPIAGIAQAPHADRRTRVEDPIEEILSRYGSELGHLKRIG